MRCRDPPPHPCTSVSVIVGRVHAAPGRRRSAARRSRRRSGPATTAVAARNASRFGRPTPPIATSVLTSVRASSSVEVEQQPLGAGRAGRERLRGQVVLELGEREGQRPRVVGVHEQQLEHAGGADVAAVAPAVGDRALGGREHAVQHLAVDVDAAPDRRGGGQQVADLEGPLQVPAGPDHVPAGVAHHARGHALQGQDAGEHPAGRLRDLVAVLRADQRRGGPVDGAEATPDVAGELVADALQRVAQLASACAAEPTRSSSSSSERNSLVEVGAARAGQPPHRAQEHLEAGAARRAGPGAEVLGVGVRR